MDFEGLPVENNADSTDGGDWDIVSPECQHKVESTKIHLSASTWSILRIQQPRRVE